MKRIGIFGGSFSPPHKGHFRAISAFLASEEPDEMLVIPAHTPPHKMLKGDTAHLHTVGRGRLVLVG